MTPWLGGRAPPRPRGPIPGRSDRRTDARDARPARPVPAPRRALTDRSGRAQVNGFITQRNRAVTVRVLPAGLITIVLTVGEDSVTDPGER